MREDGSPTGTIFVADGDAAMLRRLAPVAAAYGLAVVTAEPSDPPRAVVVDVEGPEALHRLAQWRARWPDAIVAGHLASPDRELWVSVQRSGADLVCNRGALAVRLRERLGQPERAGPRRFPLLAAADIAGRLGLLGRFEQTPVGPVALFRVGPQLCAITDSCPHAGAVLSQGELASAVLTCPRHGSQFDVRTGERLRGPADREVAPHRVVEEAGQVSLVLDPDRG